MKLNDEEIMTLKQTYLSQAKGQFILGDYLDFMLKIQDEKSIADAIKWLEGICTKHEADNPDGFDQVIQLRMDCSDCWQELRETNSGK
jgi:hypothetical protein